MQRLQRLFAMGSIFTLSVFQSISTTAAEETVEPGLDFNGEKIPASSLDSLAFSSKDDKKALVIFQDPKGRYFLQLIDTENQNSEPPVVAVPKESILSEGMSAIKELERKEALAGLETQVETMKAQLAVLDEALKRAKEINLETVNFGQIGEALNLNQVREKLEALDEAAIERLLASTEKTEEFKFSVTDTDQVVLHTSAGDKRFITGLSSLLKSKPVPMTMIKLEIKEEAPKSTNNTDQSTLDTLFKELLVPAGSSTNKNGTEVPSSPEKDKNSTTKDPAKNQFE